MRCEQVCLRSSPSAYVSDRLSEGIQMRRVRRQIHEVNIPLLGSFLGHGWGA